MFLHKASAILFLSAKAFVKGLFLGLPGDLICLIAFPIIVKLLIMFHGVKNNSIFCHFEHLLCCKSDHYFLVYLLRITFELKVSGESNYIIVSLFNTKMI